MIQITAKIKKQIEDICLRHASKSYGRLAGIATDIKKEILSGAEPRFVKYAERLSRGLHLEFAFEILLESDGEWVSVNAPGRT